ncbi:uncharacterized protein LOC109602569 isoform X2 [Aethina tumida]|nr:uncharacterized protein LOC109602569 isoform X2 [Aethina tumida]XP_049825206.1 uncharacterized protein LOC109602569 isoform X2 [Aethina tumida]
MDCPRVVPVGDDADTDTSANQSDHQGDQSASPSSNSSYSSSPSSTDCSGVMSARRRRRRRRLLSTAKGGGGGGGGGGGWTGKLSFGDVSSWFAVLILLIGLSQSSDGFASEFDKTEEFMDKIGLEKSIAAVFNKVAYGSTTKRSIPDNAYPVTTLATPLLTTYRYSDGNDEWLRVDLKNSQETARANVDFEQPEFADLEKDHALPTSAPAADILKNNNNKNYNNPNRYNNDRLRPDFQPNGGDAGGAQEHVTENVYKTTTTYNLLRNVKPTKSMYSKDIPSYVPPSRAFFTPPLPPEYQNPFADKPTLRGTNSESYANRRPIPPPSLMPNKDRIPFRPDLPKVNAERVPERIGGVNSQNNNNNNNNGGAAPDKNEKKKSLNTPSQSVKLGEFYGLNRASNDTNFEYEKSYVPSITRILSGSNGRHDDIPDILLRTVTATPNLHHHHHQQRPESKSNNNNNNNNNIKTRAPEPKVAAPPAPPPLPAEPPIEADSEEDAEDRPAQSPGQDRGQMEETGTREIVRDRSESVTVKKEIGGAAPVPAADDVTTQMSDTMNLANVKEREGNATKIDSDSVWRICWRVHVYLVVFCYILLAAFSIYKLIRYENDPHMFSKSYFLTVHLMLTVICVLRIFYLIYDPYNEGRSFNVFLYEFLHSFPLSLLATTFAVLILFLLKRTLTHLEVKTRPVFLVVFALLHIVLCFCLSVFESFGYLEKAGLTICKPVFVLLSWALGVSYLYLYRIIKNVLAKKSQNLSEMCSQNISYASHITIAVALLFVLLGFVQLYALFFIKVDRFDGEIKHHWILWSFELSVRFIEISIITLLAVVVSLRMSQREKQIAGGFPLFPCTTSDSSTDNIYPNNCNTNPNALNYSRQEMILDQLDHRQEPPPPIERPSNLLKHAFQNESFDKKSTLERYQSDGSDRASSNLDRFERPKWGSERCFDPPPPGFERGSLRTTSDSRSSRTKYYTKPKYDDFSPEKNIYSEPLDNNHHHHLQQQQQLQHQYERTVHEFERNDFDRRSRNSSNTSGRRSRKNHARPHLGVQTLPGGGGGGGGGVGMPPTAAATHADSMLVDEQGFVRFRHLHDDEMMTDSKPRKSKRQNGGIAVGLGGGGGGGGGDDMHGYAEA